MDSNRIEEYKSLINIINIINENLSESIPKEGLSSKLDEQVEIVMEFIDSVYDVLSSCCHSAIEIEQTVRTRHIQRGVSQEINNTQQYEEKEEAEKEPEPEPEPQPEEESIEEEDNEAPVQLKSNAKFLKKLYKTIALKCHPDKTNDTLLTQIFPYLSESKNDIRIIGLMYLIGRLNLDVNVDVSKHDERLIKSCISTLDDDVKVLKQRLLFNWSRFTPEQKSHFMNQYHPF